MRKITSTFDFFNIEQQYSYEIFPGTTLYISRTSHSVAHLYFRDNNGNKIPHPIEFSVYTFDYENVKKRVLVEKFNNEYLLCWTENYEMEWNGEIKLTLQSRRQWDIITDDEY